MQLQLLGIDEATLQAELARRTGLDLALTVTNNSSSLMAFHPGRSGRRAKLRIHHMFLRADPHVVGALATWLTHNRHERSAAVIDSFIRSHEHLIQRARRNHRLRTAGDVHDLRTLYDQLNAEEFEGRIDTPITWGHTATRTRRRSIRLGSFSPEEAQRIATLIRSGLFRPIHCVSRDVACRSGGGIHRGWTSTGSYS